MTTNFKALKTPELVSLLASLLGSMKGLHEAILERDPSEVWKCFKETTDSNQKIILANFIFMHEEKFAGFVDMDVVQTFVDKDVKHSEERGLPEEEGDGRVSLSEPYA